MEIVEFASGPRVRDGMAPENTGSFDLRRPRTITGLVVEQPLQLEMFY